MSVDYRTISQLLGLLDNALCELLHKFVNVESTFYEQSLRGFRPIPTSFGILDLASFRFLPCLPFSVPLRIDLARERTAHPLAMVSNA